MTRNAAKTANMFFDVLEPDESILVALFMPYSILNIEAVGKTLLPPKLVEGVRNITPHA